MKSQCRSFICLDIALIREILKLARGINEFLSDLVGKLNCCDQVTNAITEAHVDIISTAVLIAQRAKGDEGAGSCR
jgi:hypothetical protein